jgi:hypothetical protein
VSRTFLALLSLSALVAYVESLEELETTLQGTIGTLRGLHPVEGIDPNGSRWVGCQLPEGWEEKAEQLALLWEEETGP